MKYQDEIRFEFREFGKDLSSVQRRLSELGTGVAQPPSRETYIVTRLNIESNVKIRAKRLQVKGLRARLQMLEQWQPVLNQKFPITAREVEDVVLPALGLDVDLGETPPLSEGGLLALVAQQPALATIEVDKRRTLYDLGGCEAEFCELKIGEDRLQTVAVEAVEADAAKAALQDIRLEVARNESYAAFLQRRLF